eukprot:1077873_1
MDTLDLTEGLCGWNSDESPNQARSMTPSHETELRNMFNELKIVHPPKKPYQKNHTQRPKSSSLINIKRRQPPQNTAKTARVLSKKRNSHTPKHRSPDSNQANKSSKTDLHKPYVPPPSTRKTLQRSYSNLYIRDAAKSRPNTDSLKHNNKDNQARQLNIELNLNTITTAQQHLKTDGECITFSEALYRSKYPETAHKNNTTKKTVKSKKRKKAKFGCQQRSELQSNPNKYGKVLMSVNDFYTQQQLRHTPFLTPSSSMMSLHDKHTKSAIKKTHTKHDKKDPSKGIRSFKKPKARRKSRSDAHASAIPIKCFNSTVFMTHEPRLNTCRASRSAVENNSNNDVRSRSVDCIKDHELKDNGFSLDNIKKYHHEIIRNKENMKPVINNKNDVDEERNVSLELKIKHVIARWESQEKIKTRQAQRLQRLRP